MSVVPRVVYAHHDALAAPIMAVQSPMMATMPALVLGFIKPRSRRFKSGLCGENPCRKLIVDIVCLCFFRGTSGAVQAGPCKAKGSVVRMPTQAQGARFEELPVLPLAAD